MGNPMTFPSTYAEIAPRNPRAIGRHLALNVLGRLRGGSWAGREFKRPRVHFIYLHHCYPDEETRLRQLLGELARDHDFVSYSEGIRRVREGRFERPSIAVSFDDGVHNTLAAARILEEFGLRGCFFLCPGIVGEKDPDALRRFCLDRLQFVPATFLDWADVEDLLARGHEIGGHTVSHVRMSTLTEDQMDQEVGRCRELLEKRIGRVRHFAWPFGRFTDVMARTVEAVYRAGFETCASAERGCHVTAHQGPLRDLCLRRETIVAGWPVHHSVYLMARSIRSATAAMNQWPETLRTNH